MELTQGSLNILCEVLARNIVLEPLQDQSNSFIYSPYLPDVMGTGASAAAVAAAVDGANNADLHATVASLRPDSISRLQDALDAARVDLHAFSVSLVGATTPMADSSQSCTWGSL